jgi:hypothetical protein
MNRRIGPWIAVGLFACAPGIALAQKADPGQPPSQVSPSTEDARALPQEKLDESTSSTTTTTTKHTKQKADEKKSNEIPPPRPDTEKGTDTTNPPR